MRISDWSSYVCSSDLGVLVYGHANGADIEATVDQVGVYREMGYRAVRAQSGIPGVKGAYGVGKGDLYYEPAEGTLPTETLWSTTASLNHAPKLFDRLSAETGSALCRDRVCKYG